MIIKNDDIAMLCSVLKKSGQKIVLTNGCFDIIHAGHITYLEKAASYGDCLIVGLNTDASVKRWKNDKRPIVPENERAIVINALKSVTYVVLFDETNAEKLIEKVRPDIYVKGSDYSLSTLPEAKTLQKYGGHAEFIKLLPGCSTTNIIKKVQEICS
ncbi:D-glycero-beta-D-manno-heptose 1-phosphate adenylyltransferase [Pectinatus haikarae]|uniref:D-glycero-beta-D-manno-heptose 1-phosphate adenylyltransferase n=1 Tax=Pectinatus haikarae TaxID=349096 RepID=A0ABT9Y7H9_9FIRM|nr:D-glycero-beta-D-manno-heptose 1-phosphate adenylyltransferase [Pectinatus haikarae]MDQ0203460.1 rfaE bifunctional protein nucleotidyltransferase chain/domain [Pectinatus haikarae]